MREIPFALAILVFGMTVVGCGRKDGNGASHPVEATPKEEGDHHQGARGTGATFQAGKGIALLDETRKSIGLQLSEVAERTLEASITLTAQVYRSASETSGKHIEERSGFAYAAALMPPEIATQLKSEQPFTYHPKQNVEARQTGVVWKVDKALLPTLGKVEALLELQDSQKNLPIGAFIEALVPLGTGPMKVLCIPHSAVLQTSTGTFAFVQNGEFLLRTEIKTGSGNQEYVEITEGLYEGDIIVTEPVETLYLIELHATKGGGHSH